MKIGFWNTKSHRTGSWTSWEKHVVLEESKYFIKVRKWLIFSQWLPKKGLGMRLLEITNSLIEGKE